MRRLHVTALVLVLALVGVGAGAGPIHADEPDPIAGAWTLITALGGRDVESQLEIERDEDGSIAGTYTDSGGTTALLEGLTFEDGVLRFSRLMGSRRIAFVGKVDGSRLAGQHRLGERKFLAWGARGADALAVLRTWRKKASERGGDLERDYEQHSRRAAARDAFPVLFDPKLTPAAEAHGIRDDEPVIGVALGDEAKAYPISIMGRHELANDTCGGQAITASW